MSSHMFNSLQSTTAVVIGCTYWCQNIITAIDCMWKKWQLKKLVFEALINENLVAYFFGPSCITVDSVMVWDNNYCDKCNNEAVEEINNCVVVQSNWTKHWTWWTMQSLVDIHSLVHVKMLHISLPLKDAVTSSHCQLLQCLVRRYVKKHD